MSASTLEELDGASLVLERKLSGSPELVWSYLADPARRATWLGSGTLELRDGGRVDLTCRDAQGHRLRVGGTVTRVEPPGLLELRWEERGAPPSQVRLELKAEGQGTRLLLTHVQGPARKGHGSALAWGALLGALADRVQAPEAHPVPQSTAASPADLTAAQRARMLRPPRPHLLPLAVVAAVLVAGSVGAYALYESVFLPRPPGCPNLNPTTISEPGPKGDHGWSKAANPLWLENGSPVLFVYDSVACPYCAASSWAIEGALQNFSSSTSGEVYGSSSASDFYPNTPGVELYALSATGTWVHWDLREGTSNTQIALPSLGCPESSYVASYDPAGAIPFLVVGGVYFHIGTLGSPTNFTTGGVALTPAQVQAELAAGHGNPAANPVSGAVLPAQYFLEAYLVKVDQRAGISPPASVLANPYVGLDLSLIT